MLTWSLGCTPSPGQAARSPRWRSCSSRCPSRSGRRRSGTGRRACRRRSRRRRARCCARCPWPSRPELAVDGGGGALDAGEPVDHRDGHRLAGDREVLDGLGGLAAPQLLSLGIFSPDSGAAEPYPQNGQRSSRAQRRRDRRRPSGSPCSAAPAAGRAGSSSQRLFGGARAGAGDPRSAHSSSTGRSQAWVQVEQLAAAAPRGQLRAHFAHERARLELPGTSANAWRTRSAAAGFARALRADRRARAEHGARRRARARASTPGSQPRRRRRTRNAARAGRPRRAGRAAGWASARSATGAQSALATARSRISAPASCPAISGRGAEHLRGEAGHHVGEPVERVGVARPVLGVAVQRAGPGARRGSGPRAARRRRFPLLVGEQPGVQQRERRPGADLAVGHAGTVGVVVET